MIIGRCGKDIFYFYTLDFRKLSAIYQISHML